MGAVVKLKGKPQPRQEEFFLDTHRHIGYGGARGGGKSWAMRRKFVLMCLKYPGIDILLLRRTYPELYSNHVLPLMEELKGIAKYRDKTHEFVFPNRSRLVLGYLKLEKDVFQYQGHEYDVIGLEEATNFTEYQARWMRTCNRTTKAELKAMGFSPRMYYTANPGGPGHGWFKRLFITREYGPKDNPEDYSFIPARVYDNKILMEINPEYVQDLESLPDDLRRAYLEGDWDVFAGQYFSEWRRDKHIIKPFPIPQGWKRFRSMDWGYNDPCAVYWHAVDPEGRVYTYRELYITQTKASDVAKKILELSEGENIAYTVASPDIWAKRGNDGLQGESIAETFINNGVMLTKADDDRLNGWQRMHEYLADAPDGKPWWQIFDVCQNLTRTLPDLVHDEHRVEDVDDKCEDHAAESCRYALMSRPSVKAASFIAPDVRTKPAQPGTVQNLINLLQKEREREEEESWLERY